MVVKGSFFDPARKVNNLRAYLSSAGSVPRTYDSARDIPFRDGNKYFFWGPCPSPENKYKVATYAREEESGEKYYWQRSRKERRIIDAYPFADYDKDNDFESITRTDERVCLLKRVSDRVPRTYQELRGVPLDPDRFPRTFQEGRGAPLERGNGYSYWRAVYWGACPEPKFKMALATFTHLKNKRVMFWKRSPPEEKKTQVKHMPLAIYGEGYEKHKGKGIKQNGFAF